MVISGVCDFVCLCVWLCMWLCMCLHSKRKMIWAVNIKLVVHSSHLACIDSDVKRSRVKVTWLWNALPVWICGWVHMTVRSLVLWSSSFCYFSVSYYLLHWLTIHYLLLGHSIYVCHASIGLQKNKVFPYSLLSFGPGADPGVQAVSLRVTLKHPPGYRLPLLSARPAFISIAFTRWRHPYMVVHIRFQHTTY